MNMPIPFRRTKETISGASAAIAEATEAAPEIINEVRTAAALVSLAAGAAILVSVVALLYAAGAVRRAA